jgi:hypothetical protein
VTVVINGTSSNGMPFTVQAPAPPVLTNLAPAQGPIGTIVTISGSGFFTPFFSAGVVATGVGGGFDVSFNGVSCGFQNIVQIGSGTITCLVPPGATTGPVVVTNGGTASNSLPFTVTPAGPPTLATATASQLPSVIGILAPSPGSPGQPAPTPVPVPPQSGGIIAQLTLTGSGLGNIGQPPTLIINGASQSGQFGATLQFVSDTLVQAIITVPSANGNTVQVQVGGTSSNTLSFNVP